MGPVLRSPNHPGFSTTENDIICKRRLYGYLGTLSPQSFLSKTNFRPKETTSNDYFFFLMYINDLPNCLRVAAPRMFADDTSITLSAKTVADLKLAVTSELNNLTCWLRANKLSLNVAKTELMIIGSTIRDKTVGKVSTFEVIIASLPSPLLQCCAKLNGFSGKLLTCLPTLNRGEGAT